MYTKLGFTPRAVVPVLLDEARVVGMDIGEITGSDVFPVFVEIVCSARLIPAVRIDDSMFGQAV